MSACRPATCVTLQGRHPAVPRALVHLRQLAVPLVQLNHRGTPPQSWGPPAEHSGSGSRSAALRWTLSPGSDLLYALVRVRDLDLVQQAAEQHGARYGHCGPVRTAEMWRIWKQPYPAVAR